MNIAPHLQALTVKQFCINETLLAMTEHPSHRGVQVAGCGALRFLQPNTPENIDRVVDILLLTLANHGADLEVSRQTVFSLVDLSAFPAVLEHLRTTTAAVNVQEAMQRNPSDDMLRWYAERLLYRLTFTTMAHAGVPLQ